MFASRDIDGRGRGGKGQPIGLNRDRTSLFPVFRVTGREEPKPGRTFQKGKGETLGEGRESHNPNSKQPPERGNI